MTGDARLELSARASRLSTYKRQLSTWLGERAARILDKTPHELTDDIRLPFSSLGEKRKLRAARGSGITATTHERHTHEGRAQCERN